MRAVLIGFAFFVGPALVFAACSQDPGSAATSSSGTGGAPNCDGIYIDTTDEDGSAPCNVCVHANCCAEIAPCRDKACIECVNNSTGPSCGPESRVAQDCANRLCLSTCSPGWYPPTGSGTGGGSGTTASSTSGG